MSSASQATWVQSEIKISCLFLFRNALPFIYATLLLPRRCRSCISRWLRSDQRRIMRVLDLEQQSCLPCLMRMIQQQPGGEDSNCCEWCILRLLCNWSNCCAPWSALIIPTLLFGWCCKLLNKLLSRSAFAFGFDDGFDCCSRFCKIFILAARSDWRGNE